MYIIELLAKILNKKHEQKSVTTQENKTDYEEVCSHIFLPIDSTGETLACTKCGLVINKNAEKIKPKNPFI